jgi:hypothetical protein
VDDAGARQQLQRRVAEQQGVDQGPVRIAGAGMHHQPGRLVDHEDVFILVQDVQRDVLGHRVRLGFLHRGQGHRLAAAHREACGRVRRPR